MPRAKKKSREEVLARVLHESYCDDAPWMSDDLPPAKRTTVTVPRKLKQQKTGVSLGPSSLASGSLGKRKLEAIRVDDPGPKRKAAKHTRDQAHEKEEDPDAQVVQDAQDSAKKKPPGLDFLEEAHLRQHHRTINSILTQEFEEHLAQRKHPDALSEAFSKELDKAKQMRAERGAPFGMDLCDNKSDSDSNPTDDSDDQRRPRDPDDPSASTPQRARPVFRRNGVARRRFVPLPDPLDDVDDDVADETLDRLVQITEEFGPDDASSSDGAVPPHTVNNLGSSTDFDELFDERYDQDQPPDQPSGSPPGAPSDQGHRDEPQRIETERQVPVGGLDDARLERLQKNPHLLELYCIVGRNGQPHISATQQAIYSQMPEVNVPCLHPSHLLELQNEYLFYFEDGIYEDVLTKGKVDCPICRFTNHSFVTLDVSGDMDNSVPLRHFVRMYLESRRTTARPLLWERLRDYWNKMFCDNFETLGVNADCRVTGAKVAHHFKHCIRPNQFESQRDKIIKLERQIQQMELNGVYEQTAYYGETDKDLCRLRVNVNSSAHQLKLITELRNAIPQLDAVHTNEQLLFERKSSELIILASRRHLNPSHRGYLTDGDRIQKQIA
jgi:hypothetical protein